jgi:hypothetical protein
MSTDLERESIYSYSRRQLFLLLCLVTLALLFVKKSMIENQTAAFEFLVDQPLGSVLHLIGLLQYLSIPLIYAWKFTALGFIIWVGCFLFGYRVTFAECWKIVIVAEFVFVIPELIKIAWFFVVVKDPNLFEIRAFYPLSIMNFVDYQTLPPQYSYPFKALNLFEPLYWYMLVVGITHYTRKTARPAWIIVLGFYVPVYLLWLVFYMIVY